MVGLGISEPSIVVPCFFLNGMKIQPLRFQRKRAPGFLFNTGSGPYKEATNSFLGGNSKILFHCYPDVWGDDPNFKELIFPIGLK